MRREVQKRDVEERSRYCPRTGADIEDRDRRRDKDGETRNKNQRGGYGAPIIVPATPNSELAKLLREIAEQEPNRSKRFKIVEKGGRTIERSLMRPNPGGSEGCEKEDCPVCKQGEGGRRCHVNGICYDIKCKTCQDAIYFANLGPGYPFGNSFG